MADIKIAEEGISCIICSEKYDLTTHLPRILPCFHSFCSSCLEHLSKKTELTCPSCQRTFSVSGSWSLNFAMVTALQHSRPDLGSTALTPCIMCEQPASHRCVECDECYCENDMKGHLKPRLSSAHHFVGVNTQSTSLPPAKCAVHGQEYRFYCTQDKVVACADCCILEHAGHKCKSVGDAYLEQKESVDLLMEETKEKQAIVEKAEAVLAESEEELKKETKKAEEAIDEKFRQLQQLLEDRKKALKDQLHTTSNASLKELRLQRDQLATLRSSLKNSSAQFLHLNASSPAHLLVLKQQVGSNLETLASQLGVSQLSPNVSSKINFVIESGVEESLSRIGDIKSPQIVSPPHSVVIEGEGCLKGLDRDQRGKFVIQARDGDGKDMKEGGVTWEFRIEGVGEVTAQVKDLENGKYSFEYAIPITAEKIESLEVSVAARGLHIQGSPFRVNVLREIKGIYARQLGSRGSGDGQFSGSFALASDGKHLFISDHPHHRIQVFDKKGTFLRKWGSSGTGDGQLSYPMALDFDDNELFVLEYGNQRVQVFSADGVYKRKFSLGFSSYGMCVLKTTVFASNTSTGQIHAYTRSGALLRRWGFRGSGPSHLSSPMSLCVQDSNLYVADLGNNRVQVYDVGGTHIRSIEKRGELVSPSCVAISGEFIYVGNLNSSDRRIHVFDKNGKWQRSMISSGSGEGQVGGALYSLFVFDGQLYLPDYSNPRVVIFN